MLFALCASLVCLAATSAAAPPPALAALERAWAQTQHFSVWIDAWERAGAQTERRSLRFSYRRPDHAELEVHGGPLGTAVVLWNGGERVVAYRTAFAILRRSFALHDPHVESLRGNGVTTPILGPVIACFLAHAADLSETAGPAIAGEPTDEVAIAAPGGLHCPQDSPRDAEVTRDVLFLSRSTHFPLRRVRYAGDEEVERWDLRDLRVNE